MAAQAKSTTGSNLESATKRVRKLNDGILERAQRGGEASLEAYEGLLKSIADYQESAGERTGEWTFYFRNGRVKATGAYLHGELTGPWEWYRESGQPLQTGAFRDGQQDGLWKRYQASGKLLDVGLYAEGKKAGEWKTYDANGGLLKSKEH